MAMTARPLVSFGLDDQACAETVEGALRLLEETGMGCGSAEGQDFFAQADGIRVENERVRFDRGFVEDFLKQIRDSMEPPDSTDGFRLRPPWTSLNIADVRSGEIRPGTEEDLARAVRLYEAMGIRGGMPPVDVGGVPPQNQDLVNTRVCLENSESFAGPTGNPEGEELDALLDMFAVVGRRMKMSALFIISPMRFDDSLLEFCLRHRDDARFDYGVALGGMPCVGATSPLFFPAAFCQTVAEGIAASVANFLLKGDRNPFSMRSDPFDFRFGNYLVGSAEAAVLNMVSARLYEYLFGVPRGGSPLLSMARWPDAQAVHDHTVSAYLGAMRGATSFGNSGQLAHDEVFSPEIVVIDRDIVRSAERFVKGVEWEGGERGIGRSLEIIREGLESSSFLDHDTTVAECRNFFFAGGLFKGMNLGQWRQAGAIPLIEEAARQVDELVAGNEFRRPDDQVRELRRIYDRAATG